MNTKRWTVVVLAAMALLRGGAALAEDFSRYTNEEMLQKRNEVRNMSDADRQAFRAEMQNRMRNMSEDEREQFRANAGAGQGSRDGSGGQRGSGGGRGMGMGR